LLLLLPLLLLLLLPPPPPPLLLLPLPPPLLSSISAPSVEGPGLWIADNTMSLLCARSVAHDRYCTDNSISITWTALDETDPIRNVRRRLVVGGSRVGRRPFGCCVLPIPYAAANACAASS
jgi:hypothetical protein